MWYENLIVVLPSGDSCEFAPTWIVCIPALELINSITQVRVKVQLWRRQRQVYCYTVAGDAYMDATSARNTTKLP